MFQLHLSMQAEAGFVDEDTIPTPATKRGHDRLAAEEIWQDVTNAEIFRVAGIYGPGEKSLSGSIGRTRQNH